MADPAHEATRPADGAAGHLAKLRWELRSQAARARAARDRLYAVTEVRSARAGVPQRHRALAAVAEPRSEVLPAPVAPAVDAGERRLRVVVTERRQVSLEVESKIGAPAPGTEAPNRLAS